MAIGGCRGWRPERGAARVFFPEGRAAAPPVVRRRPRQPHAQLATATPDVGGESSAIQSACAHAAMAAQWSLAAWAADGAVVAARRARVRIRSALAATPRGRVIGADGFQCRSCRRLVAGWGTISRGKRQGRSWRASRGDRQARVAQARPPRRRAHLSWARVRRRAAGRLAGKATMRRPRQAPPAEWHTWLARLCLRSVPWSNSIPARPRAVQRPSPVEDPATVTLRSERWAGPTARAFRQQPAPIRCLAGQIGILFAATRPPVASTPARVERSSRARRDLGPGSLRRR